MQRVHAAVVSQPLGSAESRGAHSSSETHRPVAMNWVAASDSAAETPPPIIMAVHPAVAAAPKL